MAGGTDVILLIHGKVIPVSERVHLCPGHFPASLEEMNQDSDQVAESLKGTSFALVSLDPDLYAPTLAGLDYFYPRLSPGGMIVLHDYDNRQFVGVQRAVREYEQKLISSGGHPLRLVPIGDLHGSCVIIK